MATHRAVFYLRWFQGIKKPRTAGRGDISNYFGKKETDHLLDTRAFFDLGKKQKPLKLKQMENNCSEFKADYTNQ